jgi:Ca2+-binding EF-hand superfamily protein
MLDALIMTKAPYILQTLQVSKIMKKLDLDGDQRVDYAEFLAATLRLTEIGLSELESQGLILKTFNHFDQQQLGYLTKEDVKARGTSDQRME